MRICFLNQAPKKSAAYEAARIEAQLNSYASPGTKVEIVFPDNYEGSQLYDTIGAQSVLNGLHHMMETPSIVRKIFWAAENGYDAVISSNTFDPGVDGGRLAVNIPVIGLLRTSMHAALTLADRVGITVPLPGHVPYTWRILRRCRSISPERTKSASASWSIVGDPPSTNCFSAASSVATLSGAISHPSRSAGDRILLPVPM